MLWAADTRRYAAEPTQIMSEPPYCADMHHSEFQHFDLDLGGLESEYDLGYKWRGEQEADPGPRLNLFVSVRRKGQTDPLPTLHYFLSRSDFAGGIVSNDQDVETLLKEGRIAATRDVALIHAGQHPASLDRPERLRPRVQP